MTIRVLGFAGSLRAKSYNRAAIEFATAGMTVEAFDPHGRLIDAETRERIRALLEMLAASGSSGSGRLRGPSVRHNRRWVMMRARFAAYRVGGCSSVSRRVERRRWAVALCSGRQSHRIHA